MSTISTGHNLDPGQYRVVINQPLINSKAPGEQLLPSLEVPIPHYRLGTPRFSTRGTAFLHSQVYSRASTHGGRDSSTVSGAEFDSMFPVPPGVETHAALSQTQSQAASQSSITHTNPASVAARIPITAVSPVYHRAKEPIVPAIYNAISANPDDPAIVRYALSTREISAASPARLIAQITSKNFLDYELLSDFFLTVRAYMSTHDLLAYLLTRFEWAINRFDDDGRVIRVRAFAAIRHWVLNYFPYDFVVDRDLRVKFCQYLNNLTRHVRQGAPHDPSDLKLIIDLKKCWNGRCALYWDDPLREADGRHDRDINPGGIVGSRDSRLTHPSELWAKIAESSSQQIDQAKSVAALHNWVDSVIEAEVEGKAKNENRGVSLGTARSLPMSSPMSEQSIPAMSCTIPGRVPKAYMTTQSQRQIGPHPVPATLAANVRKIYPSTPQTQINEKPSRIKHEHKRSGSFSDALRDKRTSLPLTQADQPSKPQVVMTFPFPGSLIRGSVFPPGSPFIDGLSPQESSGLHKQGQYVVFDGSKAAVRPMSPGVKNLLGTIRRAIGSKQNASSTTPALISTAPFMMEKDSGLPMHIAYKIEGFGDQHHQLEALKKNARIDLLCADVTEIFERAMSPDRQQLTVRTSNIGLASGNERDEPLPEPHRMLNTPEREALQRTHSEMTNGSQSIVIVDDTASEKPPVPSLPSEFDITTEEGYSLGSTNQSYSLERTVPPMTVGFQTLESAQSMNRENADEDATPQSVLLPPFTLPVAPSSSASKRADQDPVESGLQDNGRAAPIHRTRPSVATGKSYISYRSSRSEPGSLRKYASYQSGMRKSGLEHAESPTTSLKDQVDQPPGRMLRRRPGGDLRANQNVHDMEPIPRPKSTGSITTYTDSMRGSTILRRTPVRTSSKQVPSHMVRSEAIAKEKPVSMMDSRRSKPDLRPSFEAAVAEFARIPDDDGGDLEATLLKLEGKFRKSPIGSSDGRPPTGGAIVAETVPSPPSHQLSRSPRPHVGEQEVGLENGDLTPPASTKASKDSVRGAKGQPQRTGAARSLYADSEDSYNSTPLLERGSRQNVKPTSGQSNVTIPRPLFSPTEPNPDYIIDEKADGSSLIAIDERVSYDAASYQENMRRGRYRSSMPTCTTDSFLLDEDEFLSDLSSELSDDSDLTNDALDSAFESSVRSQGVLLPPDVEFAQGYLPSPPMTTETAMAITSETNRIQEQRKPPTPEPSPVSRMTDPGKTRTPNEVDGSVLQPFANTVHQFPTRRHIPFTLAFDAGVLAQQFTLIERDALNEINWQDLIEMRWQNSKTETLNWVEYLRFTDPTGIELVTARFNLMVKWAQSEIVLTHNVEERALAIIKFIQVAQNAKKYHNYATMLQMTIALTSVNCARLIKTWARVPEADKASLKELERLVSPLRNFYNLRQEMEAADLEDGCIPVVGEPSSISTFRISLTIAALFIHDLTYNAQKPSVIASTRDHEPLVNFERYRTTATIVKSLLRLVDASAKYDFTPVEGAIQRCLWMASMSEDGIRVKSKEVEPS